MKTAALLLLLTATAMSGCGGASGTNPCLTLCNKRNSCSTGPSTQVPCAEICVYGGNYLPGLAPAPVCPDLAAQQACVDAAVKMSCDSYESALQGCPTCGVLDGSPCKGDLDCQKYVPSYRCDLGRPGGYCTAPCQTADDCSAAGPEICTAGNPPSFAPQAPATQMWCLLGCQSDAGCRTTEGYACTNLNPAGGFGVCDTP